MTSQTISLGTVLVIGGCGFLGHNIVNQLLNYPLESQSASSTFNGDANNTMKVETHRTSKPSSISSSDNSSVPLPSAYPPLKGRYPTLTDTTVHALDLYTSRNVHPGATYHSADITSQDAVLEVFRKVKPDTVIHTASPPMVDGKREMWRKVNVEGTQTLLDVASGKADNWGGRCRAFVYTSSSSVVHDAVSELIDRDETWPLVRGRDQKEYYTETKADAEALVLAANRQPSHPHMLTCAIRPAAIFGEGDGQLTHKVVAAHRKGQTHFQIGDNNNLWDFTYAGNAAYCHILAAQALLETGELNVPPLDHERVDGEAFNVTNDQPIYFWDFARLVWNMLGGAADPTKGQVWVLGYGTMTTIGAIAEAIFWCMGKTPYLTRRTVKYSCLTRYYSCAKAKRRLGYRAIVGLDEAIGRAVGRAVEMEREEAMKKGQ